MSLKKTGHKQRRLRTDTFLTFGGKVLTLLLGVVTTIIIARELGPSGRGILAVAYSLTLMLVQVGSFGLVSANPFFTARDASTLPRIVTNSLWFAGGLGVLLISTGLVIKLWLPFVVPGIGWTELAIALAIIPAALMSLFLQSILLGQGRMVAYNGIEVSQAILALVALIVGFSVFDFHEAGALAVLGLSTYVGAVAFLALQIRYTRPMRKPDLGLARKMLKYGFRVYVATLMAFFVIRVDLLLVNAYLGTTQAGLYSIVAALAQGMYLLPLAIAINVFPRVARGADFRPTAEVFRSVAVLYGLLCLISVPLAAPGIRLLFGGAFADAAALYYWILPGIFSLGMLTILSHHFAGRGFPLKAMLVWFPGLGLNVIINVLFLASQGTYIASLSSSIAYTFLLLLHMRLFTEESGGYAAFRPRLREVVRFVRVAFSRAPT